MRRLTGVTLMVSLALGAAGCDNNISLPTNPSGPVETITESFAGSITPNGAVTYFYNSTAAGNMTATILTLKPDSTVAVGLAIGTWDVIQNKCQTVISNERASQGSTVTGQVSAAGSLCVRIFDTSGTLTGTSQFEIIVVHP